MAESAMKRRLFQIKGSVTVTVEGFFLEKFTNLCAKNGIKFWNVHRKDKMKMKIETSIKDFKKMRIQARKCSCRLKIQEKNGLPFFMFRYRKRKIFVIGLVAFLSVIWVVNSMIWSIQVEGNKTIATEEILMQLEELGLKKMIFESSINKVNLSYKMMILRSDISFIGIETKGIKAKVKIVEKVKVPEKIDKNTPCDIVSSKDGIIKEMEVLAGAKVVQVGTTVKKGDILVSKRIEMKNFPEKSEEVHSIAKILARVWYEQEETLTIFKEIGLEKTELFAYKIAYDKIIQKVPDTVKIVDEKVKYTYEQEKVKVNIVVETVEDIGEEAIYGNFN